MAVRNKRGARIKAQPGRLVTMARRTGVRKGVLGGNRAWLAVAIATWGWTKFKQVSERQAEVVLSEELEPGQRIVIANGRATVDN